MQFTDRVNLTVNPFSGGLSKVRLLIIVENFEYTTTNGAWSPFWDNALLTSWASDSITLRRGFNAGDMLLPEKYEFREELTMRDTFLQNGGMAFLTGYSILLDLEPLRIPLNCLIVPERGNPVVNDSESEEGTPRLTRTEESIFIYCSLQDYNRAISQVDSSIITRFNNQVSDIPDGYYSLRQEFNRWLGGIINYFQIRTTGSFGSLSTEAEYRRTFILDPTQIGTPADRYNFFQINRFFDDWSLSQSVLSFDTVGLPDNSIIKRNLELVGEDASSNPLDTVDFLELETVQFFYNTVKFTLKANRSSITPVATPESVIDPSRLG